MNEANSAASRPGEVSAARETRPPSKVALVAAGGALLIWIVFAIYLVTQSGASDVKWARIAWVFGSVQAVAFAAAGLLFGTTVNRQRAERAEQQAAANQRDAESGRALAAALKADEPAGVVEQQRRGPGAMGAGVPPEAGRDDVAARHARLARQFFP